MNKVSFLLTSLFFLGTSLHAEEIKVIKVKGRQAIIQSQIPLEEGQTYTIDGGAISQNPNYAGSFTQIRKNSLSLGLNLYSIKGDTVQENAIDFKGLFGWNFDFFEFGPMLSYKSLDVGAGATQTVTGGAYFDFNIERNKAPQSFLIGPTASASFGVRNFPSGGSANILGFDIGGFLKWFLFNSSTALRFDLTYRYQKISSPTAEVAVSGFATTGYLSFYF